MAQEIIAVNILVHSCRTSIVGTICLCLSLSVLSFFFRVLSRSLSFSPSFAFCPSLCLHSSTHTENRTKSNETQPFSPHSYCASLCLSLPLFSLFNQSTSIFSCSFSISGIKADVFPYNHNFSFRIPFILAMIKLFHERFIHSMIFIFLWLTSMLSSLYDGENTIQRWANQLKTMPQFPDR